MLELDGLNYWAIVVAWLINCAVGAWWYSPAAFGPLWHKLAGNDILKIPEKEATRIIGFVMISAVFQAFVLAVVLNTIGATTVLDGLLAGALLWLGLTAATTVGVTLYSRRGWRFWWLNSSYFLLVMAVNAVILAVWR